MIKNIIFDFGRVIVDFDETKMTRAYVKDESLVPLVRDTVFDRLYWDPSDLGNITDDALKAAVATRLPKELVPAAHAVYDNWIYLTVVFNDTTCSVYENGSLVSQSTIGKVTNSSNVLKFAPSFTGRIDEYRIHDGAMSAAYVAADYATQTDPDFLAFGEVNNNGGFMVILR